MFNILLFKISYIKFPDKLLLDDHSTHKMNNLVAVLIKSIKY